MAKCAVKRGFFVLRDCGERANARCKLCARGFCSTCSSPLLKDTCVECWAQAQSVPLSEIYWTRADAAAWHIAAWSYAYREAFLAESDFKPFYTGNYYDDYYDDYDMQCFIATDALHEIDAYDDFGGDGDDGNFFDS